MGAAIAQGEIVPALRRAVSHAVGSIFASRKMPAYFGRDDAEQEAWLGVMSAVARFDGSRKLKAVTFLGKRAHGALWDKLRREGRVGRYGNTRPWIFASNVDELLSVAAPDAEPERKIYAQQLLGRVASRPRRILTAYFFDGCTMREIGKREGLGESRVSQIISESIQSIREGLS